MYVDGLGNILLDWYSLFQVDIGPVSLPTVLLSICWAQCAVVFFFLLLMLSFVGSFFSALAIINNGYVRLGMEIDSGRYPAND